MFCKSGVQLNTTYKLIWGNLTSQDVFWRPTALLVEKSLQCGSHGGEDQVTAGHLRNVGSGWVLWLSRYKYLHGREMEMMPKVGL